MSRPLNCAAPGVPKIQARQATFKLCFVLLGCVAASFYLLEGRSQSSAAATTARGFKSDANAKQANSRQKNEATSTRRDANGSHSTLDGTSYHKLITFEAKPSPPFSKPCNLTRCNVTKAPEWRMVVCVASEPGNFGRRDIARRTWASWSYVEGALVSVVFAVAKSGQGDVDALLTKESWSYGDMLLYDRRDEPKARHERTARLAGKRWAAENLPDHYIYVSVDDDVLVDLGSMQEAVTQYGDEEFPVICWQATANQDQSRNKSAAAATGKGRKSAKTLRPSCERMYATTVRVAKQFLHSAQKADTSVLWGPENLARKLAVPLVQAERDAAHPYTSDEGDFMRDVWLPVYDKFASKRLCVCNY